MAHSQLPIMKEACVMCMQTVIQSQCSIFAANLQCSLNREAFGFTTGCTMEKGYKP